MANDLKGQKNILTKSKPNLFFYYIIENYLPKVVDNSRIRLTKAIIQLFDQ